MRLERKSIVKAVDTLNFVILCHGLIYDQVGIEAKPAAPDWTRLGVSCGRHQIAAFAQARSPTLIKANFSIENYRVHACSWHQMTIERAEQVVCQRRCEPFFLKLQPSVICQRNNWISVHDDCGRRFYLLSELRGICFHIGILRLGEPRGVVQ